MLPFSAHIPFIHTCELDPTGRDLRLAGWLRHDGAATLISGGDRLARHSYWLAHPTAEAVLDYDDPRDATAVLREATAFVASEKRREDLPPFTGGLLGMASFELGLRLEGMKRRPFRIEGRKAWPELLILSLIHI